MTAAFSGGGIAVQLLDEKDLCDVVGNTPTFRQLVTTTVDRYREAHRSYHDARHVLAVASRCVALAATMPSVDRDAVVWASLFHDAIYDPRSSTNEADSAVLAAEELRVCGCSTVLIDEVVRLILLTAGHAVAAGDTNGAVIVDADLAVLGGTADEYRRYVDGVRAEYSFVPDDAWQVGRARVLKNLLALPRLFTTDAMSERNGRAQSNMRAELLGLSVGVAADRVT